MFWISIALYTLFEEIGNAFMHFTTNLWVFDNINAMRVSKFLNEKERQEFNIDVTKINWRMYIMNFAYGIKRFILKEEAELPSEGYNRNMQWKKILRLKDLISILNDVISLMNNSRYENFIPFLSKGKAV